MQSNLVTYATQNIDRQGYLMQSTNMPDTLSIMIDCYLITLHSEYYPL